jgi:hypothetical protein|tara:strand:+ start:116 stop:1453 length:1338 start_codon:yes stop_codon:yes gene_type:complete
MKNLFEISPEENNRIKTLHENYKIVHGTTSLLNEQATDRTLKGVLLDSGNKEPITGANIYVTKDTKKGTTSDSQGKFELKGIKPGESVTISFIGYKTNIINNTTIDTKTGVATEYFLEMGNEVGEVEVKAEKEGVAGCMDPKAKNYNPKAWIDCKGTKFKDANYTVKGGESEITLPTSGDYDTSCCEYYEGCLDEDSKNYYKNNEELLKAEKDGKEIKACKGCCEKYSEGCKDPSAINYDPNAERQSQEENIAIGCKYPADQRKRGELITKNFQEYYMDNLVSAVINLYTNEKGRDSRDIKKLFGNHKIDNVVPSPLRTSNGDWIGFSIPLQPDTEKIKRIREKISVTKNKNRKQKLLQKLKELGDGKVEISARFGKNIRDLLTFNSYKEGPEVYIRPRGSKKRGKRVYVGPKAFNQKALTKLVSFLQALNKQRDLVPKTSSDFE